MDELYYERLANKFDNRDMKSMGPADIAKMSARAYQTAEKRQQCDKVAMTIIEYLVDRTLEDAVFIRCLRHINQQHFQDVSAERAIVNKCGYPICENPLPQMPAKKYHIVTKQNKVYDITERKNFCSNFCYAANCHIRKQVETSPLWLRSYYATPQFKLLPVTDKVIPGIEVGEEEDASVTSEETDTVEVFAATSMEMFKPESEAAQLDSKPKTVTKKVQFCEEDNLEYDEDDEGTEFNIKRNANQRSILKKSLGSSVISKQQARDEKYPLRMRTTLTAVKDTVVAREPPAHRIQFLNRTDKSNQNEQMLVELADHVKKCLNEWLTLDTFLFLYGKDMLKETFAIYNLQESLLETLKQNRDSIGYQQKYEQICQRLNLSSLADGQFDSSVSRPLQDFKRIKIENKVMDRKVKSFLGGVEQEIAEENVNDLIDENEEAVPAVLPIDESNSQNALRKKIYLSTVNRIIYKLISKLNLCAHSFINDLNQLVNTFKLDAHNIVFKPKQWNLIGVILLKSLSLRDNKIRLCLEDSNAKGYIQEIMTSLKLPDDYLTSVMNENLNINYYFVNIYLK